MRKAIASVAITLRRGLSKSCGCFAVEQTKLRNRKEGSAFRDVLCSYKASARVRDIPFLLSTEEAKTLFESECFYCGVKDSMTRRQRTGEVFKYNGIDRKNPNKPYHVDNCVAACSICNRCKQSLDDKEFIDKCKNIASRHA